jgi:hypothetical protein
MGGKKFQRVSPKVLKSKTSALQEMVREIPGNKEKLLKA